MAAPSFNLSPVAPVESALSLAIKNFVQNNITMHVTHPLNIRKCVYGENILVLRL